VPPPDPARAPPCQRCRTAGEALRKLLRFDSNAALSVQQLAQRGAGIPVADVVRQVGDIWGECIVSFLQAMLLSSKGERLAACKVGRCILAAVLCCALLCCAVLCCCALLLCCCVPICSVLCCAGVPGEARAADARRTEGGGAVSLGVGRCWEVVGRLLGGC
jgi:hypothetical protein